MRRGRRGALTGLVVAVLIAGVSSSPAFQAPRERIDYRGTGVVLALLPPPSDLHATRPVIVIQHEPIRGLMEDRMSMPFIAASLELFRDVKPGDRIAFGLRDTSDALLVVTIERVPGAPVPARKGR